jgi:hypothetical protein
MASAPVRCYGNPYRVTDHTFEIGQGPTHRRDCKHGQAV